MGHSEDTRRPRDTSEVLGELREMRARIAEAKSPSGVWDAKTGPGRMQDIELAAQAGALLAGKPVRDVTGGLDGAVAGGWLGRDDAGALKGAYALFWSVVTAARLIAAGPVDGDGVGEGGAAFFCRSTGFDTVEALRDALEEAYEDTAARIDAALEEKDTA